MKRRKFEIAPTHPTATSSFIVLRDALKDLKNQKQLSAECSELRQKRWRETSRGDAHKERFSLLRLDWSKPAPTILKVSGSGGHMHPDVPRLLSVGELQRCASFPDAFNFAGKWDDGVCRIGNSVPPLFMRAIARHIRSEILKH